MVYPAGIDGKQCFALSCAPGATDSPMDIHTRVTEQIPRLRCYARVLTRDRERADELVQDCLERALSRLHRWRAGSDLRAWLFSIMHNLHVNQLRRHRNGPDFVPLEDEDCAAGTPTVTESSLDVHGLEAALAALPDEQREIIQMVCLEEMKYEDVAKILAIPLGTVMSRLHRGRERLRASMSGNSKPHLRRIK